MRQMAGCIPARLINEVLKAAETSLWSMCMLRS